MSGVNAAPSRGESLYLQRRRKGLNQVEAAEQYGVAVDTYRDWEADRREHDQPRRYVTAPTTLEQCVLLRRRKGMTQKELAAKLGCTRLWVNHMEKGTADPARLHEFWGL